MERVWKILITGVAGIVAAGSLTIAALVLVGGRLSDPAPPVHVTPPVLVSSPAAPVNGDAPTPSTNDNAGEPRDGSGSPPTGGSRDAQGSATPDSTTAGGAGDASDDGAAAADFDD